MAGKLETVTSLRVRFHECDPLQIVWHGNYLKYFEEGREDFCHQHGISYLHAKDQGFSTPIVKSLCEHKLPLKYGDTFEVKTSFINSEAAKMIFEYQIFKNMDIICTGQTVQVFLDEQGQLQLKNPPFFLRLEKENGFGLMKKIFLHDDCIISPLGFSTRENLEALREERSGLRFLEDPGFQSGGYYAGIIDEKRIEEAFSEIGDPTSYTKLEQMMILAVHRVLQKNPDTVPADTGLIISTTKGNIEILRGSSDFPEKRLNLSEMAGRVAGFFGFPEPIVVSNACISGGLALVVAKRFINSGRFSKAVVVGGDIVSEFVVSGFKSFMALSETTCRPFSKNRDGINLGEAAAAILVSDKPCKENKNIVLAGEASANDANHISGPHRTGEGLYRSIIGAFRSSAVDPDKIGYISAHGTGTLFNDEMESQAFYRAELQEVEINSYKAYYGHTLGASALLESILTIHSLKDGQLFKSLNYDENGLSRPLNIVVDYQEKKMEYAMKTASGFGGCNIALIFKKLENEL